MVNTSAEAVVRANEDALLREVALARILGCSLKTLQSWRQKGVGPAYIKVMGGRRGGSVRYRPSDVEEFLRDRTVRPARQPWGAGPASAAAAEA